MSLDPWNLPLYPKPGILLAVGSLLLIGITLVPALIFKEDKARLGQ